MAETYEVTSQRDGIEPDGTGNLVPVRVITFKAKPSGQPGTVKIPVGSFTADAAAEALAHAAGVINAVQSL